MQLGLVDEIVLWVHPVILGEGIPLFREMQHRYPLKLLRAKTFSSGVVILCYEKASRQQGTRQRGGRQ